MSVFGVVRRAMVATGRGSHEAAVANARAACTDLSRRRVERAEVEAFLAVAWPRPAAATGRRTSRV